MVSPGLPCASAQIFCLSRSHAFQTALRAEIRLLIASNALL